MRDLKLRRLGPDNAGQVPYLSIDWDQAARGVSHEQILQRLHDGDPRIEVWPTRDRGLCVTPFMLELGQDRMVGRRLMEALRTLSA